MRSFRKGYLNKLISSGLKVAICEQVEDSSEAKKRGAKSIVKRAVQRIVTPGTLVEENLLDATHAWKKLITDEQMLSGLPESAIELATQTAKNENKEGWLFTLDFPSYMPVMQYADNAELRKEFYKAYVTRASDTAPNTNADWDNSNVMLEILKYRTEKAKLLGFQSYAHYSLEPKWQKILKKLWVL